MSSQAIFTQGAAPVTPGAGLTTIYAKADTKIYAKNDSGTEFGPLGASSVDNSVQDFRLTLTTAVPITTSDVTGATTIFCCPYKGNTIALYDGANWNYRTSAQFSIALGTLTSGLPYDVFCFDNSTVPTLEILAWTSGTARATALVYQDGILVKSGATTRRYLGTFYTTSTTTTEDSQAKRYLFNYYNRVARKMIAVDATVTWTYTLLAFRQANANTANQLNFVVGVSEDSVQASIQHVAANTNTSVGFRTAVGLDSTTTKSADCINNVGASAIASLGFGLTANYEGLPGIGVHFLAWLESSTATGTTTWSGTNSNGNVSGIVGRIMA